MKAPHFRMMTFILFVFSGGAGALAQMHPSDFPSMLMAQSTPAVINERSSFFKRVRDEVYADACVASVALVNMFNATKMVAQKIENVAIESIPHIKDNFDGQLPGEGYLALYVGWRKGEKFKQYGNWYGDKWSGGSSGDECPVDSLDEIALWHDNAYEVAIEQGKIFGFKREQWLKALADDAAAQLAEKLPQDPTKWDRQPLDVEKANRYRDKMITGFNTWTSNIRFILSVEANMREARDDPFYYWFYEPKGNIISAVDLSTEVDIWVKKWRREHPQCDFSNNTGFPLKSEEVPIYSGTANSTPAYFVAPTTQIKPSIFGGGGTVSGGSSAWAPQNSSGSPHSAFAPPLFTGDDSGIQDDDKNPSEPPSPLMSVDSPMTFISIGDDNYDGEPDYKRWGGR